MSGKHEDEKGAVLILIMVLIAILAMLVLNNGRVVHQLRQGLRQIEKTHDNDFKGRGE